MWVGVRVLIGVLVLDGICVDACALVLALIGVPVLNGARMLTHVRWRDDKRFSAGPSLPEAKTKTGNCAWKISVFKPRGYKEKVGKWRLRVKAK